MKLIHRPRLQFGIRSALLSVLAVSITLGWFAAVVTKARQQKAAAAAIQGMGGRADYADTNQTVLKSLTAQFEPLLGVDILANIGEVRFQRADNKRWTQEEMREYGPDATADELSRWEPWTRENLVSLKPHFENLPRLEFLSFRRTTIPRNGLAAITGLRDLRSLDLEQTRITSADLEHLMGLDNLEILSLRRTRIRDEGLQHLKHLSRLKKLHLGSTAIGDAGVEHIATLPAIERLNLENTRITDKSIPHLRRLVGLKSLNLRLTDVSRIGYDSLTTSLPKCRINWGGLGNERCNWNGCSRRVELGRTHCPSHWAEASAHSPVR